jgi:beta-carotene ketolase (CrtW type)
MKGYISIPQFVKLQATVIFLAFFGAPIQNMLLFWAGAGLVSAVRLFYFGTYLPHKPRNGPGEVMAWAKARSAKAPTALSFLRCYCFDMVSSNCSMGCNCLVSGKERILSGSDPTN